MTKKASKKPTKADQIRKLFAENPNITVSEAAKRVGVLYQTAYNVKNEARRKANIKAKQGETIKRKVGRPRKDAAQPQGQWVMTHISTSDKAIEPKPDNVNHPAHYKVGGLETIDFIEAKGLGYNLGNVIKYITRAAHKGNASEDLAKARWYLNREIAKMSSAA